MRSGAMQSGSVQSGDAPTAEPSHQILEQAAQWFALLRSGAASAAEQRKWQQWLDRAPEHQQAWQYVERVGRRFAPLHDSPDRDAAVRAYGQAATHAPRGRRAALLSLAGLLGGGLAWGAWRYTPLPAVASTWGADYRAGVGETRRIALPDGTQVWLKARSAFNIDYTATQRRLQGLTGEMLIDTGRDPLRPFFVDTQQGRLQALGTRFTVRQEAGDTLLTVFEGAVKVDAASSGASGIVPAGRQLRFTADALQAMTQADPAREAWTHGVLVADNLPLSEVVAQLQGYRHGHLGVSPKVADLRVFGSYPLHDADRALDMLASVLPIRVRRTLPWWISVEPQA